MSDTSPTNKTPAPVRAEDPVSRLDPPGLVRSLLKRLGIQTVGELARLDDEDYVALPRVGDGRIRVLAQLVERARETLDAPGTPSLPGAPAPPVDLAARLAAQGIDLSAPWREVLVMLPLATRTALAGRGLVSLREVLDATEAPRPAGWIHGAGALPWRDVFPIASSRVRDGLIRLRVQTLEDVLVACRAGRLSTLPNFGRRSQDEVRRVLRWHGANPGPEVVREALPAGVRESLEAIARDGLAAWRHGSPEPIETPDELIARALATVEPATRKPLRAWLLGRRRVADVANSRQVAWHSANRPLARALAHLRVQFGDAARAVAAPLVNAVDTWGPFLHRSDVDALAPGMDLHRTRFVLALAGKPVLHFWERDYLVSLPATRMDDAVARVKRLARDLPPARATLARVCEAFREGFQFEPRPEVLAIMVETVMRGTVSPEGRVAFRGPGRGGRKASVVRPKKPGVKSRVKPRVKPGVKPRVKPAPRSKAGARAATKARATARTPRPKPGSPRGRRPR